jgi:hypothetical protein
MAKSISKLRHISESNQLLENRFLNEQSSNNTKIPAETIAKNDIVNKNANIFSDSENKNFTIQIKLTKSTPSKGQVSLTFDSYNKTNQILNFDCNKNTFTSTSPNLTGKIFSNNLATILRTSYCSGKSSGVPGVPGATTSNSYNVSQYADKGIRGFYDIKGLD